MHIADGGASFVSEDDLHHFPNLMASLLCHVEVAFLVLFHPFFFLRRMRGPSAC